MQFSISVRGDKELRKALRGYNEKVRKGLMREVAGTAAKIDREAKRNAPVATGLLRNRITFVVQDLAATVFSNAKYSTDVEKGQKPGSWPNRDDIERWARRKLKVPKNRLKSVAFLVSRKIHDKGTKAQPYFEPAVDKGQRWFYLRVKKRVFMKDPTSELHEAYYNLLNGQVTISGTEIPVYKWERPGNETRIEIASTTLTDDSSKDTYILEVLQDVTIVSSLRISDERQVADEISSEVCELVVAETLMTMDSFDMLLASLTASEVFEDESYDNTTYRKELTFRHLIVQK